MSLEQALQENTAAMIALTAAYLAINQASTSSAEVKTPAKTEVKKTDAKKTEPAKEAPLENPELAGEDVAKTEVTYEQVRAAVLDVAKKKSRTEAEAVLSRFGVDQISKIKPESYADVLAFAKDVLAGKTTAAGATDAGLE